MPPELAESGGALIYLSLGSLGSADVELMRRLVEVLARRRTASSSRRGRRPTCTSSPTTWSGHEFVPQPAILPQVDLVITHGGNNTVDRVLPRRPPMILLPLFWDQYDNAQRVARDRASGSVCRPTRSSRPR